MREVILTKRRRKVVDAAKKYGHLDRKSIKKHFRTRDPRIIDNVFRAARELIEENILERNTRGVFMLTTTVKEKRIASKLEQAMREGKQVTIEGKKKDGTEVVRIGFPKEIKFNKEGQRYLVYQDVARRGYRSLLLHNITKVTFI